MVGICSQLFASITFPLVLVLLTCIKTHFRFWISKCETGEFLSRQFFHFLWKQLRIANTNAQQAPLGIKPRTPGYNDQVLCHWAMDMRQLCLKLSTTCALFLLQGAKAQADMLSTETKELSRQIIYKLIAKCSFLSFLISDVKIMPSLTIHYKLWCF